MDIRKHIEANYTVENGVIRNPGKFEGTPVFVPYYYEVSLEGGANDIWTIGQGEAELDLFTFYPTGKECLFFPEISHCYAVVIWTDDYGFVNYRMFTTKPKLSAFLEEMGLSVEEPRSQEAG